MEGKEKDTTVIIQTPIEAKKNQLGRCAVASIAYGIILTVLMVAIVVSGAIMYKKTLNECHLKMAERDPTNVLEDSYVDAEGLQVRRQMELYSIDEVGVYR